MSSTVPASAAHDSALLPRIPSEDEDLPTRLDPVRAAPVLVRLLWTLMGVWIGMALVDRVIVHIDSSQGADGGGSAIMPAKALAYTNRPHFENPELETRLDRFGLRNPEIPLDAPLDEVRVAGFGASRIYGAGGALQSWCWNYQLEQVLDGVRVLNGGVMAYSALQSARRARLFLDAVEPDLVFVLASPGRQALIDNSAAFNWVQVSDDPEDVVPARILRGLPEFLQPAAVSLHRFANRWSGIYRRSQANLSVGKQPGKEISKWQLSKADPPSEVAAAIERTLAEFEALAVACEKRGIELRALVFPEIEADSEIAWQSYLKNNQVFGAPPIGTPRLEPTQELVRLLEQRGVAAWDFSSEATYMGENRQAYIMGDNFHWSQPGHEVMARGLARRLREDGLLDALLERRAAHPRTRAFGEVPFPLPSSTPQ